MFKNKFAASIILLALASIFSIPSAQGQDYHWVGGQYYNNDFVSDEDVQEWKLSMLLSDGLWSLGKPGAGSLAFVNRAIHVFELDLVKDGDTRMFPLSKTDGSVELDIANVDGFLWFSLDVNEYDQKGKLLATQSLVRNETSSGNFTISLNKIKWNNNTTQISFNINGYSIFAGGLDITHFHYKHNDTSWSNILNWAPTAGGTGGLGVPTSQSNVVFDNASSDCTISGAVTVNSLSLAANYKGVLKLGSQPLNVNAGVNVDGGTLTGGSGNATVLGTMAITSGTFTAPSGTLTVKGGFNLTGGTFAHNNGTVELSATTAASISGSPSFYNLTIKNGGQPYSVSGNVNVANNLVLSGTTLPTINSGSISVKGNVTGTGTLNGSLGTTNLVLNGTSNQSIDFSGTTGTVELAGLTINKTSGTASITSNMATRQFTQSAGQFALGTKTLTVAGNFTIQAGTFSVTTGQMNVSGNWVNNATFSAGTSTVNFNGESVVSGTAITTFNNMIVGGKLTSSNRMALTGNFTNNGSFIHNNGTLEFKGTQLQRISGTAVTDFNNIQVSNSSVKPGVSVETDQNLRGVLTLGSNVQVDADGASNNVVFTLKSTADNYTQDAAIGVLPSNASVSGKVTIERFMSLEGYNKKNIYRYIASPIQNATVADIQNEIPVTGPFTGSSICSGCTKSQTMFEYDEKVITDTNGNGINNADDGYINFPKSSNTEILVPGKGYAMYVMGSKLTSATWNVRGNINQATGQFTLPVTRTSSGNAANDGWNLVGNPFPSTIDWNASGWTKNNINAAIYVRDNGGTAAQFASWNGVTGTNGGSRYIAMGQAFWVKAEGSGTPSLRATESVKAPGTQTIFFRESAPANLLRITMSKDGVRDEAVIHFRDDASVLFDDNADAEKMFNGTFNLSTVLEDGKYVAINSLPIDMCGVTVPLSIDYASAGTYNLNFSEFESFIGTPGIVLTDNFTGQQVDVLTHPDYSFEITSAAASKGLGRFSISFSQGTAPEFQLSSVPVCTGQDVSIAIANAQPGLSYVALVDGVQVSDTIVAETSALTIIIPGSTLNETNTVNIRSLSLGCIASRESNITVHSVHLPGESTVSQTKACQGGEVTLTASASDAASYRWYTSADATTPSIESTDGTFTTPFLDKSRTFFVAGVNANGCEGVRVEVQAVINLYDDVVIQPQGNLLESSYKTGNQWYLDGSPIEGATSQTFQPSASGQYTVAVDVDGCTTTADYNFVVTAVEHTQEFAVNAYPNPVVDYITIVAPTNADNVARIYNSNGKPVGNTALQNSNGQLSGQFSFNELPSGVYIVAVGQQTVKILKQ